MVCFLLHPPAFGAPLLLLSPTRRAPAIDFTRKRPVEKAILRDQHRIGSHLHTVEFSSMCCCYATVSETLHDLSRCPALCGRACCLVASPTRSDEPGPRASIASSVAPPSNHPGRPFGAAASITNMQERDQNVARVSPGLSTVEESVAVGSAGPADIVMAAGRSSRPPLPCPSMSWSDGHGVAIGAGPCDGSTSIAVVGGASAGRSSRSTWDAVAFTFGTRAGTSTSSACPWR